MNGEAMLLIIFGFIAVGLLVAIICVQIAIFKKLKRDK
jgi:hypothetical protein